MEDRRAASAAVTRLRQEVLDGGTSPVGSRADSEFFASLRVRIDHRPGQ